MLFARYENGGPEGPPSMLQHCIAYLTFCAQ